MKTSLSADECADLRSRINKLRVEIQTCDPKGKVGCDVVVRDICCPISASGGPIEEFEVAVQKFVGSCSYGCTQVMCPDPTKGVCGLNGQCQP